MPYIARRLGRACGLGSPRRVEHVGVCGPRPGTDGQCKRYVCIVRNARLHTLSTCWGGALDGDNAALDGAREARREGSEHAIASRGRALQPDDSLRAGTRDPPPCTNCAIGTLAPPTVLHGAQDLTECARSVHGHRAGGR